MMSAAATAQLLNDVLVRLRPHLPEGVDVEITPHGKWTSLQRVDVGSIKLGPLSMKVSSDGSGRPVAGTIAARAVRSLRPWVPFLPRGRRQRLTAQCAVEVLLDVAYDPSGGARSEHGDSASDGWRFSFKDQADIRFAVKAVTRSTGVAVSFRPPTSQARVELTPIPFDLL
jgi:hypothetical protein